MSLLTNWQQCAGSAALVVVLGCSASASAATAATEPSPQVLAAIDTIMMQGVSDKTPGCVLGLHSKNVDVVRAYGQADLERHVAMDVDSVFNIASTSKQFTAAAVLLLANEGKLSLEGDLPAPTFEPSATGMVNMGSSTGRWG